MAKQRLINLNVTSGAFVDVLATIWCRRMDAVEDDAAARQGFDYKTLDDAFATTFDRSTTEQPLIIGNVVAMGNNKGPIIGAPAQTNLGTTATKLLSARSRTATVTTLRVTEYE